MTVHMIDDKVAMYLFVAMIKINILICNMRMVKQNFFFSVVYV